MFKNLKELFCYDPKFSWEWLLYFIIEISLIVFFVVSCYNVSKKEEDTEIKFGLNLAIECAVLFIGMFLLYIVYNGGKLSKLKLCFFKHISPFLVVTAITAMISTVKHYKF